MISTISRPTRREDVPRELRFALYALIIISAVASLPFIGQTSPLPTTTLLDAWVIVFIVTMFLGRRLYEVVAVLLLASYLLTRVIPALVTEAPLEDFLQAYRWVLYLIAFAFAVGKTWGPLKPLIGVYWAVLLMALVKYAATVAVLGFGSRPGLLLENNFELALLSGLMAVLFPHMVKRRWLALSILAVIVVISGSRSGALAFLVLALYSLTQLRTQYKFAPLLAAHLAPLVLLLPAWIFIERAANSTQLDRLNFLEIFLAETAAWSPLQWLFGTTPITPLSSGACFQLSYYEMLFASTGDGTCYSVILHAFILRVVFDAGLVGLLIAVGGTWYFLRRAQVQTVLAIALVAIAVTNGLSVSGLNNPYVALPVLFAILVTGKAPQNAEAAPPRRAVMAVEEGQLRATIRPSDRSHTSSSRR